MLRGKFPRSPVWLRKIPSTVSGSQGSRRGLPARRALRVPAWREDVYYGFPRPGSRESSDSGGFITARGRIPQSRRSFPSSRNRYRGGLAAHPCGGASTTGESGDGRPGAIPPAERAPVRPIRPDGKMPLRRNPPRAAPAPPTASCYIQRRCARAAQAMMRRRRKSWRRRCISDMPATAIRQCPRLRLRGKERDVRP